MTESPCDKIKAHLTAGGVVQLSTYYKYWVYDKPQHAALFRSDSKDHLYVKHGKHWLDCTYSAIRFGHYVEVTQ